MKPNRPLIVILSTVALDAVGIGLIMPVLPGLLRDLVHSSRQPDGCGLSWSAITVIKTGNVIVFQVVIWPVQLNPVNVNPPLKEANFPAMS